MRTKTMYLRLVTRRDGTKFYDTAGPGCPILFETAEDAESDLRGWEAVPVEVPVIAEPVKVEGEFTVLRDKKTGQLYGNPAPFIYAPRDGEPDDGFETVKVHVTIKEVS